MPDGGVGLRACATHGTHGTHGTHACAGMMIFLRRKQSTNNITN